MHSLIAIFTILLASGSLSRADVYVYRDLRTGGMYATDTPAAADHHRLLRVDRTGTASRGTPEPFRPSLSTRWIGPAAGRAGLSKIPVRRVVPMLRAVKPACGRPFKINEANRRAYAPHVEQVARTYGLDPKLVDAVISAESAYNPKARSPKGALGLMQLMPDTARRFGVRDPRDPLENLHGGGRYLRWLLDYFNGDTRLAVAAYNAGEGAVQRHGNAIPPYAETQTYVARVMGFYGDPMN